DPNCDATKSTEGTVGGPDQACTGGTIDGNNNCVLTNGTATLTIPLNGPPYAVDPPENINVASLSPATCADSFISLQGAGSKIASCTGLLRDPAKQNQNFAVPLELKIGWRNKGSGTQPTCLVTTPGGDVYEGNLQVYRNDVAVTQQCDPVKNCN